MGYWPNDTETARITAKPYPWKPIADFNPDCQPSHSAIHIEAVGERVLGVLQVKGLGVVVFTALPPDFDDASGRVRFEGMLSTFTNSEIGWSEKLR